MRKHRLELTGKIVTADAGDGIVRQGVIGISSKLVDNALMAFSAKLRLIIKQ